MLKLTLDHDEMCEAMDYYLKNKVFASGYKSEVTKVAFTPNKNGMPMFAIETEEPETPEPEKA